jgi:hypothetical protein
MSKERTETVWIIVNKGFGAYTGWELTRKDMILQHCRQLECSWDHAKRRGDRAVKATLTYSI